MKKSKKLLVTASLVSATVTMGGCRFLPWANNSAEVYGPPPSSGVTLTPVPGYETEEKEEDTVSNPVTEEEENETAIE